MWVGHYAVGFALKAAAPRAPLGWLFVAVQALDIISVMCVFAGWETWRIVPGITAASELDLHIPFSHGLLTSSGWAALTYIVVRLLRLDRRIAAVFASAVWSHFWLDVLVHRPDLPIWDDTDTIGLGLWRNIPLSFAVESSLLVAGLVMYLRASRPVGRPGEIAAPLLVAVMIAANAKNLWQLSPPRTEYAAVTGSLASALVFALLAVALDRLRLPGRA